MERLLFLSVLAVTVLLGLLVLGLREGGREAVTVPPAPVPAPLPPPQVQSDLALLSPPGTVDRAAVTVARSWVPVAVTQPPLLQPGASPDKLPAVPAVVRIPVPAVRPVPRPDSPQVPFVLPVPRPAGLPRAAPEPGSAAVPSPTAIPGPAAIPRPEPGPSPVQIVMLGDSITEGGQWGRYFPSLRIANHGVSSDTTARILGRLDAVVGSRPKRTFIMAGINDIYNGSSVGAIFERYARLVRALEAERIEVVIQSTIECRDCDERLVAVRALNARLRGFARQNGNRYIDLNAVLSDAGGLREAFTWDGVHLRPEAYRAWVRALRPYMSVE